jgi:hypothetical protein
VSGPTRPGGAAREVVRPFPGASVSTSDQVPPEVRDVVDLLREACGRNLVCVVFFGSRLLGTSPGEGSAADLFVVVENYLRFYESIGSRLPTSRHSGIMAALNRVLPPNIIYLNDPGDLRAGAKCFIVTEGDLAHELSADAKDHFFRGRLSQRVHIVHARSGKDRIAMERRIEAARYLTLDWVPLFLGDTFNVMEYCQRMLEVSYAGEIRPEARSRVAEVYNAQSSFFRLAYGRVLQEAVVEGDFAVEGDRFRLLKRPTRRQRWRVGHFFRRSKFRATMRWFKYMLTFDDWLDYIVRKIERRSGVRIELTKSERRFPIIFLWPKALRVIRAMRNSDPARSERSAPADRSDA